MISSKGENILTKVCIFDAGLKKENHVQFRRYKSGPYCGSQCRK